MANHAIRDLVSEISGGFFSIICDEYTDISDKEQLTIFSIYTLSDLGVLSNLIGSLSLANEHYSPPTE